MFLYIDRIEIDMISMHSHFARTQKVKNIKRETKELFVKICFSNRKEMEICYIVALRDFEIRLCLKLT